MNKNSKEIENDLRKPFKDMSKDELIDKLVSLTLEQIKDCNTHIEKYKMEIAQGLTVPPVNFSMKIGLRAI